MEKHTSALMSKTQYSLSGSTVQVWQEYAYYVICHVSSASHEYVKHHLITTEGT